MKKIIFILTLFSAILFHGCEFLDIVPDDTATLDDAFKNESTAEDFIYTCYSHIPNYTACRSHFSWLMSNETVCSKHWGLQWFSFLQMQQLQYSSSNPVLDIWQRCYQGIKQCYIFQSNIDKVVPVSMLPEKFEESKKVWIAETNFLIAYFHAVLMQHYGPVVIVDTEIPLNGSGDTFFRPRKSYDECVAAVAEMFDRAIADLPMTVLRNNLGRATKVNAQALKARMYMFAASPLFNGNSEFYADFKDKDGNPLISQTFDKEKWKKAMEENKKAITMAEQAGNELYRHVSSIPLSKFDQAIANQRYTMVNPWNNELIWGYSGFKETTNQEYFQTLVMPKGFGAPLSGSPVGGLGPTLRAVEFFYSENGIPCDEDPDYDWENRMDILPGDSTIYLHRNREPRFYAYVGYDRGPYEINGDTLTLKLRFGEPSGVKQADLNADHLYGGYALKKGIHPANEVRATSPVITINPYPHPIIRLGELYMNYAEACAEYTGSLDADATRYFNAIRDKAGLPTFAESFGNKTGQELIKVVRRERMNELIFEGHWLYDLRRWKEAIPFFKEDEQGMRGLTSAGATAETFYQARVLPERPMIFTEKQYLYPIRQTYIDVNPNLIQNPGW
ncbi:RagB/SusD family nutrient uptake outer membrane protein [Bacteroides sp. UBA939]|uniref:RagB/SusD family nutrient uptake outer membrane protein n=1 Tax=Bacteroides sp. UBA939 TaxID=1946092 RepID=UPI0025B9A0A0|nr:RagB/SusD family nutrient uptake outer membrane protein [Bacteroides sp. UBA939]